MSIEMMEDTGNGMDWLRTDEQFSHVLAVARYSIF
jgi:hypothetical protein